MSNKKLVKQKVSSMSAHEIQKFKLPDSMSFSEINFPVLIKPEMRRCAWKAIKAEQKLKMFQDNNDKQEKNRSVFIGLYLDKETDYIRDKIFPFLMPVLEQTLNIARAGNVFEEPKCLFNGVDHMAQLLWNSNPRYPKRKEANLYILNMPWVQEHLNTHPRPLLPKSWLWTKDYAATLIQKSYRRYLTQLEPEVQEMRDFWKKLQKENKLGTDVKTNPLVMKILASQGVSFASIEPEEKNALKKLYNKRKDEQVSRHSNEQ